MKLPLTGSGLKALSFLCLLCAFAPDCVCLDREAFSITNYELAVRVEPDQHRLGARGKITLRNDTSSPQKIAVLQISSSLDWRSIRVADKPVQFMTQPYTSDLDHTGSFSEAIVTLPQEVAAHGTIDIEIGYEGVVLPDTTRLTRIDTPEEAATAIDWDQISPSFTGVRGIGHVAWYPIATDSANLSEDSVFDTIARWKDRESGSKAHIKISFSRNSEGQPPKLLVNESSCVSTYKEMGPGQLAESDCDFPTPGATPPAFLAADYGEVNRPSIQVFNLRTHAGAAEVYADTAEKIAPLIAGWFGPQRGKAQTADLPDATAAPFESGGLLATPLAKSDGQTVGLSIAHQLTHTSIWSFRPWIDEGLAHFAQALYLEQQNGRRAALDYLVAHRSAVKAPAPVSPDAPAKGSLINTSDEDIYRSKAMSVWWMLRDMLGDAVLKKAIAQYKPEQDKDPSYMPHLISAQTQRDLEWFFDDWVYRDHGLPDFQIESAFTRKTMNNSFLLTITLENRGAAGAEVPVVIKTAQGEVTKRVEVRGKSKNTIRVEMPATPQEIVVNDGSVPESGTGNNRFKVEPPQS